MYGRAHRQEREEHTISRGAMRLLAKSLFVENPPYSCKNLNGDRQKGSIGAAFQSVTDALTV